jgi:hypothetical protein
MIKVRYAKINFQLDATDCKDKTIKSWNEFLDDAVNWSTTSDYSINFNQEQKVISVSLPFGSSDFELLETGAALGKIKAEVFLSDLCFENLWLSIQEQDTDVISSNN